MMVCPKCGAELSDTAKFCRKCGAKIEAEAEREIETRSESEIETGSGAFEEPVVKEDGNIEFDWNQPVEMEEREKPDAEGTYEWGPPLGSNEDEDEDGSMMPVQFEGGYEESGRTIIPPWDHTDEFEPEDISENKVMAIAAYVMGPLGIIIALIASGNSPFAGFHMRQALKLSVLEAITGIVMVLLCWTFIVPAAACIFLIILMVLRIIAFVSVCKGKAVELPIIRNMGFMK